MAKVAACRCTWVCKGLGREAIADQGQALLQLVSIAPQGQHSNTGHSSWLQENDAGIGGALLQASPGAEAVPCEVTIELSEKALFVHVRLMRYLRTSRLAAPSPAMVAKWRAVQLSRNVLVDVLAVCSCRRRRRQHRGYLG